jgi:hypothetical protein
LPEAKGFNYKERKVDGEKERINRERERRIKISRYITMYMHTPVLGYLFLPKRLSA